MQQKVTYVPIHDNTTSPEIKDYYHALGKFITAFCLVEKTIFVLSCLASRLPVQVAQALFGGSARVHESMERTRKLLEVTLMLEPDGPIAEGLRGEVNHIFAHVGLINTVRNHILHDGTDFGPNEEWKISNHHLAFKEEKLIEMPISAEILNDMIIDLGNILVMISCLNLVLMGDSMGAQAMQATFSKLFGTPWKYKPVQLGAQKKGSQKTHPKPKPQPPL